MVRQTLSVGQVNDRHFYSVFSQDDFLGPGCGDDPFLLQDYLRFHSGDADLMRDPAHTAVPCFDASEEKMAKLASDSPYVATELLQGRFIGNQAFVDVFQSVAPAMRALPARLQECDVPVFVFTSTYAVWLPDLELSGKIRTRNFPKGYPRSRQLFAIAEDLVVSDLKVLDVGIFRIPQNVSRVYVAGEVARWLFENRAELGIELGITGLIQNRETTRS